MITILELARELETTKTTISRKIEALGMKEQLIKQDGIYQLTDEQADRIRQDMNHHAHRNAPQRVPAHVPPRKSNRNDDNKIIEILERRIDAQEKQIEKKDAQIEALQKEQARLHDLLDQQQKLTLIAEQKTLALEDKQNKGIFARLFHKSKPAEQPQETQQEKTGEGADT